MAIDFDQPPLNLNLQWRLGYHDITGDVIALFADNRSPPWRFYLKIDEKRGVSQKNYLYSKNLHKEHNVLHHQGPLVFEK